MNTMRSSCQDFVRGPTVSVWWVNIVLRVICTYWILADKIKPALMSLAEGGCSHFSAMTHSAWWKVIRSFLHNSLNASWDVTIGTVSQVYYTFTEITNKFWHDSQSHDLSLIHALHWDSGMGGVKIVYILQHFTWRYYQASAFDYI